MALPSQKDRSGPSSRVYASSGGSRDNRFLGRVGIAVGVALLIAGSLWGIGTLINGREKASGEPQNASLADDKKGGMRTLTGDMQKPKPTTVTPVTAPSVSTSNANTANAGTTPPTRPLPVDLTNPNGATKPATEVAKTPAGTATPSAATPPLGTNPATNPASTPNTTPGTVTNATPGVTPTTNPLPAAPVTQDTRSEARISIDAGERALAANKLVEGRALLSKALLAKDATEAEKASIRTKLTTINQDLLFSNKVTPGDPLVASYSIQPNDALSKIARKQQLAVDWRLIQRINRIDPNRLNVGQKVKLVTGPFHAIVDKSDFRLDLFAGSPEDSNNWVYIRSFPVGLGENDGTPLGTFVIRKDSKLVNPPWTNPRTGEHFGADDPKNPIGERWLGFEGVGAASAHTGYGLHGTIDPESIGKSKSMGCVRMADDDIALVYEMLVEQVSVVKVVP